MSYYTKVGKTPAYSSKNSYRLSTPRPACIAKPVRRPLSSCASPPSLSGRSSPTLAAIRVDSQSSITLKKAITTSSGSIGCGAPPSYWRDVLAANPPVQPIFFCRDPIQGPDVIRSQQRNPANFLLDYNSLFDFLANVPERYVLLWFAGGGNADMFQQSRWIDAVQQSRYSKGLAVRARVRLPYFQVVCISPPPPV